MLWLVVLILYAAPSSQHATPPAKRPPNSAQDSLQFLNAHTTKDSKIRALFTEILDKAKATKLSDIKSLNTNVVRQFQHNLTNSLNHLWRKNEDRPFYADIPLGLKKECVFLHGAGRFDGLLGKVQHSTYWRNIQKYTPQCSVRLFSTEETRIRGWDNHDLQLSFCQLATSGSNSTVIRNKIIFSHSMANLVLAAAIKNGLCEFDSSSSWYAIAPPLRGSPVADFVHEECQSNAHNQTAHFLAIGVCTKKPNSTSNLGTTVPAVDSCRTTNPDLEAVAQVLASRVNGSLCGTNFHGNSVLTSLINENEYKYFKKFIKMDGENDGLVPTSSCMIPNQRYEPEYHKPFYLASVNHADTTCRGGDGSGPNQMPCSWFKYRD